MKDSKKPHTFTCRFHINIYYSHVLKLFFRPTTSTVKSPKNPGTRKFSVIILKVDKFGFGLQKGIQNMQTELQTV